MRQDARRGFRSPVGPLHEAVDQANTRIIRRPILGGLINEYSQAA